MTEALYVIRYEYPGTAGGQPVGTVYVQRLTDIIPGYKITDACSYTKSVHDASRWTYEEGTERASNWPGGTLVLAGEAAVTL